MEKFQRKETVIIMIGFFIIISFFIIRYFFIKTPDLQIELPEENILDTQIELSEENISDSKVEEQDLNDSKNNNEETKIVVDICGAVNNPKVVILEAGARVIDAVNEAGGLTDKADLKGINLARKLNDGEKIIVPEIGEVLVNNINSNIDNNIMEVGSRININTASLTELKTLDGIGDVLAMRIIEYRERNNGFKDIEELKNVSGIGEKKFEKIKDSIKVK